MLRRAVDAVGQCLALLGPLEQESSHPLDGPGSIEGPHAGEDPSVRESRAVADLPHAVELRLVAGDVQLHPSADEGGAHACNLA